MNSSNAGGNSPQVHRLRWDALAAAMALLISIGDSVLLAGDSQSTAAELVKIRVNHTSAGYSAFSSAGRTVSRYEGFDVFEVPVAAVIENTPGVEILHDANLIHLNSGALDTRLPSIQQLQVPRGAFTGNALHLVQFAGPIKPEWYQGIQETGVRILDYIPNNSYLVYGDSTQLAAIQANARLLPEIQWDGAFLSAYKIHPAVTAKINAAATGENLCEIQLVVDALANPSTLGLIDRIKSAPILNQYSFRKYVNVVADIPLDKVTQIADQPDVISIQPYSIPKLNCERQAQIVSGHLTGVAPSGAGYLSWLNTQGFAQDQFNTSGFVVDVSDSGLDNGTTSPNHFGLHIGGVLNGASRVAYVRFEGTPGSTLHGCDGHGNLNSHIIAGYIAQSGFPYADNEGFHFGLGICPFARVGSSVIFGPAYTFPNYSTLQSHAYADGARISSNSWGSDAAGAYNSASQTYDALVRDAQSGVPGNQEMVIVFSNGNAGESSHSVGSPATAKNVISVGAAENVQPFGGSDKSGVGDSESNSADDIVSFSSRGPCSDGRHKPEMVAPGTHVSGGVAQSADLGANGIADPCFDGSGVSGGISPNPYWPAGQQFFTASSGTSHSCPAVAGGCALLRQFFINHGMNPPSPAMTKAILMNSARSMAGTGAGGNLWSDSQGMGEMNLGEAFKRGIDATTLIRDQIAEDTFTATGQFREFRYRIADTLRPLRVTLAWTDSPGSTAGFAYNNNLDLIVTIGNNTYKGNVFAGSISAQGGSADAKDNVESVFLLAGASGEFTVTVYAGNINSDAVNHGNQPQQDFALVIDNVNTCPLATIGPDLPDAISGQAYNYTLTATGGTPPYTWDLAGGALPPNVTLSSTGVLSGTLATAANYSFTVQATDGQGCKSTRAYSISPAMVLPPFPDQGTCVKVESPPLGPDPLAIVGGTPPFSYSWTVLAGPSTFSDTAAKSLHPTLKPSALENYLLEFKVTDAALPPKTATRTMHLLVGNKVAIDAGLYTRYHPIIAVGEELPFGKEFSAPGAASLHWSILNDPNGFGTITSPNSSSATFVASEAGEYPLNVNYYDPTGCPSDYTFSVTVTDLDPQSRSLSGTGNGGGDATTYTACGAGSGLCGQTGTLCLLGLGVGYAGLRARRRRDNH
jgi:hypothetical protein